MKKLLSLLLLSLYIVTFISAQNNGNQFGNSGNVGIGTQNPNFPLEVYGQSRFHGKIGVDSIATFSDTLIMMETSRAEEDLIVNGDLIMTKFKDQSAEFPRFTVYTSEGALDELSSYTCSWNDGNGNYLPQWEYGWNEIFTFCPEQLFKVGINTYNPIQELHIVGNGYITNNLGIGTSSPDYTLDIKTESGNNLLAARFYNNVGVTTPQTNEMFFVPRLGNNGFNTTSTENDMGIFWNDNSNVTGLWNENSGFVIGPHNSNLINPGLKIGGNGFVGIGNKAPTERLEISNGALLISGSNVGSAGSTRLIINDNTNTNNFVEFSNTDGDQFFIDSEGKVYAHEVEVKLGSFPDYVFEDDYNLLSLNELEIYIKKHKHLPEVPDEDSVIKEGLNLGEMDVILLKKVEELTLYVIEQQKQIESLREELESLKTK